MKSKLVAILAAFAILALAALPASADVGIFAGTASVSSAECGEAGSGLGLLSTGSYSWEIDAPGTVRSLDHGLTAPGDLNLCGDLDPGLAGLGASCITTTGSGGTGQATFGSDVVDLDNVGWAFTVGGTFLVTGDADGGTGNLTAVVQTFDDQVVVKCVQDAATSFLVQAVYSY